MTDYNLSLVLKGTTHYLPQVNEAECIYRRFWGNVKFELKKTKTSRYILAKDITSNGYGFDKCRLNNFINWNGWSKKLCDLLLLSIVSSYLNIPLQIMLFESLEELTGRGVIYTKTLEAFK